MTNDITEMSHKEALLHISEDFELFHSPDNKAYATISKDGHFETCAIRSAAFRCILQSMYYAATKKSASSQSFQEVLTTIEAHATHGNEEKRVFQRIAEIDGCIYVDLGSSDYSVVKITSEGWQVQKQCSVKFIRNNTMHPLPIPKRGGDIHKLDDFINVACLSDLRMVIAWILSAYCQTGSYPILIVQGQQGSGKSSLCRTLLSLTDPRGAALRAMPKREQDLLVTASKNHVIAFDNLSGLSNKMSDALCRVSTGGGLGGRKLYSDDDEHVMEVKNPILVNGIDDVASRADLGSRSIVLNLPVIDSTNRKTESDLNSDFNEQKPYLLGAIFDAVAAGLENIHNTHLEDKPRMADFALWSSSMEQRLGWGKGGFMDAYKHNMNTSIEASIGSNSLIQAIRDIMNIHSSLEDTAGGLLNKLTPFLPEEYDKRYDSTWPKNPRMLSQMLKRAAPQLRHVGINVNMDNRTNKGRMVILEKVS